MSKPIHWLQRFQATHGDTYDYTLTGRITAKRKITIICPRHGQFEQRAAAHARGQGCPKCAIDKRADKDRLGIEGFIARAKEVHGEAYSYANAGDYTLQLSKVTITCPVHGDFRQEAASHLKGGGCPICAREKEGARRIEKSKSTFEARARKVHSDLYSYDMSSFRGMGKTMKMLCKEHGEFLLKPSDHLALGLGCPACAERLSKGARFIKAFLEEHGITFTLEQTFEGCQGNHRPLRFDFYIENRNVCIEFQGQQHFKPVKAWGGREQLAKVQEYDEIKRKFCEQQGIHLVYFYYNDTPEHIKKALANILDGPQPPGLE